MERLVKHLKLLAKGCSALRYEIRVFEQRGR